MELGSLAPCSPPAVQPGSSRAVGWDSPWPGLGDPCCRHQLSVLSFHQLLEPPFDFCLCGFDYSCCFILFFVVVQLLSRVRLFVTPWTAARQASLSITNSRSLLKLMSIESVMPPNHLILCCLLLLLPSVFPRIRVFSNKSVLCIRWPNYSSFSFN